MAESFGTLNKNSPLFELAGLLRASQSLCHCRVENKRRTIRGVKYWEIIADELSKAGWSGAALQRWMRPGGRSGLLTRIAGTESVSLCERMKS